MQNGTYSCPASRERVIDLYFMEHRAKVIDIAAFLDRIDRAAPDEGADAAEDFRVAALRTAIGILIDGKPERARRVLEAFSDPTTEPIAAAPMKGATGAYAEAAGGDKGARP